MGGACSTHEKDEKCIQNICLENLKGRYHMEDLGVNGKIILQVDWILGKDGGKVWTGSIWLRIGTSGRLL
jgi:hypothetical protein